MTYEASGWQSGAWYQVPDFWAPMRTFVEDIIRRVKAAFESVLAWVWDNLPEWVKNVVRGLQTFVGWLWGGITDFFRDPLGMLRKIAGWVWDLIPEWVRSAISKVGTILFYAGMELIDLIRDPIGALRRFAGWVWDLIPEEYRKPLEKLGSILWGAGTAIMDFFRDPIGTLRKVAGWVWDRLPPEVKGPLSDISRFLGAVGTGFMEFVRDPAGTLGKWGKVVTDKVGELKLAFDGAIAQMGAWVGDLLKKLGDGVLWAFQNFVNWLIGKSPGPLEDLSRAFFNAMTAIFTPVIEALVARVRGQHLHEVAAAINFTKASSPRTPEEAKTMADQFVPAEETAYLGLASSIVFAEAASAGQVDMTLGFLMQSPSFAATMETAKSARMVENEAALLTPLRYFYQSVHVPIIPDPADLIRFLVKETITVPEFEVAMGFHGFQSKWKAAFWEAHWRDLAAEQIQDAYHRGVINEAERDKYLVLIDYRPDPRPGITVSDLAVMGGLAKRLIPRVDIRRGWELGALGDEEIVKRYEMLGYEEDSELMAEIQKRVALDAEIGKVRDRKIDNYVRGFDLEKKLRANLAELGYSPTLIEMWVTIAEETRLLKHKQSLLDYYEDAWMKDMIGDEEFSESVADLILNLDAYTLYMDEAYVKKYKKPKAIEDRSGRLRTAEGRLTLLQTSVARKTEDVAEYEAYVKEMGDAYDAAAAEQIGRVQAEINVLQARLGIAVPGEEDVLKARIQAEEEVYVTQRAALEAEILAAPEEREALFEEHEAAEAEAHEARLRILYASLEAAKEELKPVWEARILSENQVYQARVRERAAAALLKGAAQARTLERQLAKLDAEHLSRLSVLEAWVKQAAIPADRTVALMQIQAKQTSLSAMRTRLEEQREARMVAMGDKLSSLRGRLEENQGRLILAAAEVEVLKAEVAG